VSTIQVTTVATQLSIFITATTMKTITLPYLLDVNDDITHPAIRDVIPEYNTSY
jgi:hypothetical protein